MNKSLLFYRALFTSILLLLSGIVTHVDAKTTTLSVTIAKTKAITCNGTADGIFKATPSGGTAPYTYLWSNGDTGQSTTTALAPGTYTCTVTDAVGATASASLNIANPAVLRIAPTQTNASTATSNDGTATATVTGGTIGTGYIYSWSPGNPTGQGTNTITGLAGGTYTLLVTDGHGCTVTQIYTITQPAALAVTIAKTKGISCNGNTDGIFKATPSGGTAPYTYLWSNGDTGQSTTTGLAPGTYTCTVTDAVGATATSAGLLILAPGVIKITPTQTNATTAGGADGTATASVSGGTIGSGYTYNWTPGNPSGQGTNTITGLTAGTYTLTVIDANGCSASQVYTITDPAVALSVTIARTKAISCNGDADGIFKATPSGGTAPYTYLWSNGDTGQSTTTGLAPGTYTCTVTDAVGATVTSAGLLISAPSVLKIVAAQTNVTTTGGSDGTATATVTGGTLSYIYNWAPGTPSGDGTNQITGLSAGIYTLTVTDGHGCTISQTYTITEPTATPTVNGPVNAGTINNKTPQYTGTASAGSSVTIFVDGNNIGTTTADGTTGAWTFTQPAILAEGTHTVNAKAIQAPLGTISAVSNTNSFTIDTQAPAAPSTPALASGSDSGTSNSDNLTNVTTPTFTGTAESGATVTLYDTDGTTILGTATATGGNWSITSSILSSGSHTITAKATDAAGNISAVSVALGITIDTTSPTLAITSNVSALNIGETATITFTFSKDPGSTFMWDGSAGSVVISGGTLSAISGSGLTRTATFTPGNGINGGMASITVPASSYTDAAGNSGGAGTTPAITIDTQSPAAPSTPALASGSDSGTSNSDNLTNVTTPTFTGTAENGATVTLYDTDGITVLGTAVATDGNWSIISSTLSPGSHTITAKATDGAGNISAVSLGLGITIDTTSPTLAITSNVSALNIGETAIITFTFSKDPGSTFTWDGSTGSIVISGGTLSAISGSGLTRMATFTPTNGINGGTASITVPASSYTDAAGNNGGAGTAPVITIDTQAPAAPSPPALASGSDSGVSNSDNITNITTPVFTGTAESGATVTLYDTDGTTLLGTATAIGGNWSITSTTLSSGSHTITAKATDAAGNIGAASSGLGVTIDTTSPTLAISAPSVNSTTTGPVTYTLTYADAGFNAATLSTNDITLNTTGNATGTIAVTGTGTTRTVTINNISGSGTLGITIAPGTASDLAGNTAPGAGPSAIFTVIGLPIVTTTSPATGVTFSTATLAGNVSADGNSTVTENGIVYSTSANPTILTGTKIANGAGTGAISVNITGLTANITYHYQAYATNAIGTSYGGDASFKTTNVIISSSGSIGTLTTIYGTPSASVSFNVSGTNMQAGILVTPPASYEVSTDNATFTNTVTVGAAGTITSTPVYIRLKATAAVNSYEVDNVVLSSASAADLNVPTAVSTVNPATLTYTATAGSKIYGTAIPTLTGTVTGFVNGDTQASATTGTLSFTTTATASSNVGSYAINGGGLTATNYTLAQAVANSTAFSITKATLTVTANGLSKVYDGSTTATVTLNDNRVSGDVFTTGYTTAAFTDKNAGTGKAVNVSGITINGTASANYTVNSTAATTANITTAIATVTAQTDSRAYNKTTTSAVLPVVTGLITGDVVATAPVQTFNNANAGIGKTLTAAGLVINDGNNGNNYTINYVTNNTGVITPATLTYTATVASKIYGVAMPTLTGILTGFVTGDTQASTTTGTLSFTTVATAASSVGSYAINGVGLTANNGNYTLTQAAANNTALSITPATLNYTASAGSKIYGAAVPTLTGTVTGFVNGDTQASATTGTLSFTTVATAASNAGSYTINGTGLTANNGNYTLVQAAANSTAFNITKAALTVTANGVNKVYDSSTTATVTLTDNRVSGDVFTTAYTTAAFTDKNAGTGKAVNVSGITINGTASANYTVNSTAITTATITTAIATVTAQADSRAYNKTTTSAIVPVVTGLITGDVVATAPVQIFNNANAGTGKTLTAAGLVINDGNNGNNYTINYVANNTGVITPAALTYTATTASKIYGAAMPSLTGILTGFVTGDTQASTTTGTLSFTTVATAASNVGSYAINGTGLTATNGNYTLAQAAGNSTALTITRAALTITANSVSRNYGQANPVLTATYTGFVNGDNATKLTTQPVIATTATTTSLPGTYPVTVSGAVSGNYTISYVPGSITVTAFANANLANLTLSDGALSPSFISVVSSYTASVGFATSTITLTPTLADPTATVTVNGATVSNGAPAAVNLNVGDNPITIVTTAQDGTTTLTYTLVVHRSVSANAVLATNILTPNGDGKNDSWVIKDILLFPNNVVKVYDRSGRIVFTQRGYANTWGGTLNGAPLNEDTYYYVIDLGVKDAKPISGYITVLRNR
jgi:gliding motility-associated-like protein